MDMVGEIHTKIGMAYIGAVALLTLIVTVIA